MQLPVRHILRRYNFRLKGRHCQPRGYGVIVLHLSKRSLAIYMGRAVDVRICSVGSKGAITGKRLLVYQCQHRFVRGLRSHLPETSVSRSIRENVGSIVLSLVVTTFRTWDTRILTNEKTFDYVDFKTAQTLRPLVFASPIIVVQCAPFCTCIYRCISILLSYRHRRLWK
jgi:hypothetical protein